jgi:hypothetical protein
MSETVIHAGWWTPLARWSAKCDQHWMCKHSCGYLHGMKVALPDDYESVTCDKCRAKIGRENSPPRQILKEKD